MDRQERVKIYKELNTTIVLLDHIAYTPQNSHSLVHVVT